MHIAYFRCTLQYLIKIFNCRKIICFHENLETPKSTTAMPDWLIKHYNLILIIIIEAQQLLFPVYMREQNSIATDLGTGRK